MQDFLEGRGMVQDLSLLEVFGDVTDILLENDDPKVVVSAVLKYAMQNEADKNAYETEVEEYVAKESRMRRNRGKSGSKRKGRFEGNRFGNSKKRFGGNRGRSGNGFGGRRDSDSRDKKGFDFNKKGKGKFKKTFSNDNKKKFSKRTMRVVPRSQKKA